MLADDLAKAQICERDGLLYAVGLAEGYAWLQWSQDGGATKAPFPDGATSRLISPLPVADEQPALVALQTGELVVVLAQDGRLNTYVSRDEGQHWRLVGAVD